MKHVQKSIDKVNAKIKVLEGVEGDDSDVSEDSGYQESISMSD